MTRRLRTASMWRAASIALLVALTTLPLVTAGHHHRGVDPAPDCLVCIAAHLSPLECPRPPALQTVARADPAPPVRSFSRPIAPTSAPRHGRAPPPASADGLVS